MKLTIGSDFELLVKNLELNKIVPVPLKFGGSKVNPLGIGNGCHRQIDCVTAEFNIPPGTTKEEFLNSINYCMTAGNRILSDINPALTLVAKSSNRFDQEDLDVSDVYTTFGCSSSIDAWSRKSREACADEAKNLRSAGFHVWIGLEDVDVDTELFLRIVKSMDLFLGLPSLLIDQDQERRSIYGQAGDCRYKQIKEITLCEYRSLGSYMLSSKELISYVYDQTIKAVDFALYSKKEITDLVREAINEQNIDLAEELLATYNIKLPNLKPELVC